MKEHLWKKGNKYARKKGHIVSPEIREKIRIGMRKYQTYQRVKQDLLKDIFSGATYEEAVEFMARFARGDTKLSFKHMQIMELWLKMLQVLTPKDVNIPTISAGSKIVIGGAEHPFEDKL